MDNFVGCILEMLETGGIKFQKKVLLQTYKDEFDIGCLKKFNTPVTPRTSVCKKPVECDMLLTPAKHNLYCSGVWKEMYMMQYS